MSDTGRDMKKQSIQSNPFNVFNNLNFSQFTVKTKFKGLKRKLSSKMTEK